MKIGNKVLSNNVFLAPMAGVTDRAARQIAKSFGPGLMYTEMVSGKALLYNNQKTETMLEISEEEKPIGAQLFGHESEVLKKIAYKAVDEGAEIIDINMGCPAPKIVSNKDGAYVARDIKLVEKIVRAVSSEVNVPVTVKLRKGWDENEITALDAAKAAEAGGASAVTVHGRLRCQFYSGQADLNIIKAVKESVKIPVIGNGDITDEISAKRMLDYTGCDGIMIGRASEGNPWIFKRVISYLKDGRLIGEPSIEERTSVMKEHIALLIKYKGKDRGIKEARKHMAWYVKGLRSSSYLRDAFFKAQTENEMTEIIDKIKELYK